MVIFHSYGNVFQSVLAPIFLLVLQSFVKSMSTASKTKQHPQRPPGLLASNCLLSGDDLPHDGAGRSLFDDQPAGSCRGRTGRAAKPGFFSAVHFLPSIFCVAYFGAVRNEFFWDLKKKHPAFQTCFWNYSGPTSERPVAQTSMKFLC